VSPKGKNSIEIYKSWCKRCGICAAFCPAGVLAQDETGLVQVKDLDRCTGCQLCELRCPDFAIHVSTPKSKGTKKEKEEKNEEPAKA
jgi:2-oxoglutarate ferredoxin oxidoreductase subunit delta